MKRQAFIALGANQTSAVGTAHQSLLTCLRNIKQAGADIYAMSSLYRTQPIGKNMGDIFVNGVVWCALPCSAVIFLERLQLIERLYGRKDHQGARTLDLDILTFLNMKGEESDRCQLPHPRMERRRFVLAPLVELAPFHLINGKSAAQLLRHAEGAIFEKIR